MGFRICGRELDCALERSERLAVAMQRDERRAATDQNGCSFLASSSERIVVLQRLNISAQQVAYERTAVKSHGVARLERERQ